MDVKKITAEVAEALEALGLPERREVAGYYCPTSQRVLGVTGPDLKGVLREMRIKYRDLSAREWIGVCKALVDTCIFDCQILAFERIGRDKKLLAEMNYGDVQSLWKNLDNWASVDSFSAGIHGVLWGRGIAGFRQRVGQEGGRGFHGGTEPEIQGRNRGYPKNTGSMRTGVE
jgi:hypothetical protein